MADYWYIPRTFSDDDPDSLPDYQIVVSSPENDLMAATRMAQLFETDDPPTAWLMNHPVPKSCSWVGLSVSDMWEVISVVVCYDQMRKVQCCILSEIDSLADYKDIWIAPHLYKVSLIQNWRNNSDNFEYVFDRARLYMMCDATEINRTWTDQIAVTPYPILNTYTDGEICYGSRSILSLVDVCTLFWATPFNDEGEVDYADCFGFGEATKSDAVAHVKYNIHSLWNVFEPNAPQRKEPGSKPVLKLPAGTEAITLYAPDPEAVNLNRFVVKTHSSL